MKLNDEKIKEYLAWKSYLHCFEMRLMLYAHDISYVPGESEKSLRVRGAME